MKGYLGFTTRILLNQLLVVAHDRIVALNCFDLFLPWVKDRLFRAIAVIQPVVLASLVFTEDTHFLTSACEHTSLCTLLCHQ